MFKLLTLPFLSIPLLVVHLNAVVYENAEDLSKDRWSVLPSSKAGKISNVFDTKKQSRVIDFEGENTKSIYLLKLDQDASYIDFSTSVIEWEMNYIEDFVVIVDVKTAEGNRQLLYTPGVNKSYLQYGLGISSTEGNWSKYSRNIEKDLQFFEKDNTLESIKAFIIKGSGKVDNIKVKSKNKVIIPFPIIIEKDKNPINEPIAKIIKKPVKKIIKSNLPIIKLNGKTPLFLDVNEEYIELGATSKNKDGSEIDITITHNIDILKEGVYTVIYIATNKLGNSSVDKRRVLVGKNRAEIESKKVKDIKVEVEVNEDRKEMSGWNRDINPFEEVEIEVEEVKKEVKRPSRPGL